MIVRSKGSARIPVAANASKVEAIVKRRTIRSGAHDSASANVCYNMIVFRQEHGVNLHASARRVAHPSRRFKL